MFPNVYAFGGKFLSLAEFKNVFLACSGYMSPEYAMSGQFSVKSDVFSFGVLVLEIISGKKNWGFYHPDHDLNLIGHVSTSIASNGVDLLV